MFISLIVCTKNRTPQFKECLDRIAAASPPPCDYEMVLVDSSTDTTSTIVSDFMASVPFKAQCLRCEVPGLGLARNVGMAAATGEWFLFTDDDCYVEKNYFVNFYNFVTALADAEEPIKSIRYGCGPVALYDKDHDPRIANLAIDKLQLLAARSLLTSGTIQGANMFFHRSVFNKVGPFNDKMGAGTPFGCEDIEMAARASLGGFVGALVPYFTVTHHHMRLRGTQEANSVVTAYDYGRGAYYASLLNTGIADVWKLWAFSAQMENFQHPNFRVRLIRELEGAANYLKSLRW